MLRTMVAGLALSAVIVSAGCAARVGVGYREYDPAYGDYHVWSDAEAPHYSVWINETHHRNVDYAHLNKHDRQDYWKWRHQHP